MATDPSFSRSETVETLRDEIWQKAAVGAFLLLVQSACPNPDGSLQKRITELRSEMSQTLREVERMEGLIDGLLLALQTRGIDVDEPTRQQITDCTDLDTLRTWLSRAANAHHAAEVFAE